jgi:hypothetical protein
MPDHLSSIGFIFSDQDSFGQQLVEFAQSSPQEPGKLATRALWEDKSGARLAIFLLPSGEIKCVKPSFTGTAQMVVRPVGMVDDPSGCEFCAIASVEVLENGGMLYPLFLELEDIHLGPLAPAKPIPLFVTGFAEELTVWTNEAAYDAATYDPDRRRFAVRSLIPSGMFSAGGGERPARAEAILTGIVTKAEQRRNWHSGATFDSCTVETLAANIDVVAPPQARPFEVGNVIQGTFWLIARRAGVRAKKRHGLRSWFGRHPSPD